VLEFKVEGKIMDCMCVDAIILHKTDLPVPGFKII